MAKKKQEDPPKGSPAWMATFSDLMNLLLCFFVLLFSMSTVDAEKMQMVIQSFQNTFSVLPAGGTTVSTTDGALISSGVSALEQFDIYFNASTANEGDTENQGNNADSTETNYGDTGQAQGISDGSEIDASDTGTENAGEMTDEQAAEQVEAAALAESEKMAEQVEEALAQYGIQDQVELDFNGQYVLITLNGALLFDSGKAEVKEEALPLVDKLAKIIESYDSSSIQIEGYTDNVPINSSKYESNDVLSMYRALRVAEYIRSVTSIDPSHIVSAGRGEYNPIADNSTPEGRARNRRVEIKIYNSYNSADIE
ncbi:MAG: flagellar motor protein MotB [Lachnospiraceae bacterium]|nr:flagellar motor protein MotB [Lachnospiraceae bacterium]